MDPTTCYQTMIAAKRSGDYATAREYALILRAWLDRGGFYPRGIDRIKVDEQIRTLLKPACVPQALCATFGSLACIFCDAGDEIDSVNEAIEAGWTKIQPSRPFIGRLGGNTSKFSALRAGGHPCRFAPDIHAGAAGVLLILVALRLACANNTKNFRCFTTTSPICASA